MTIQNLLVELFVEELPPKALQKLGNAFAETLFKSLSEDGLTEPGHPDIPRSSWVPFASPRRLAVWVSNVRSIAPLRPVKLKLMPVSVGLDAVGNATLALKKKLLALDLDEQVLSELKREQDGKAEVLFYESLVTGATLDTGLQKALDEAIAKLPIPKVMSYQLETDCELPGWSSVHFVRPAHGLVALHGTTVVPVKALGLTAGCTTQGHRFEALVSPVVVPHADQYAEVWVVPQALLLLALCLPPLYSDAQRWLQTRPDSWFSLRRVSLWIFRV